MLAGLVLLLPLPGIPALAASPTVAGVWAHCAADPLATLITERASAEASGAQPLEFSADAAHADPSQATLVGDVELRQGDRQLRAPRVLFDKLGNHLRAERGAAYGDPTMAVRARRGEIDIGDETARFEDAEYFYAPAHVLGRADEVTARQATGQVSLQGVTFSTCERGNELWQLRAGRLELDNASGRARAWEITALVDGVPVAYLPYLSFPIDGERHSGLLPPRFRYSSRHGLDLRLPYYWNIAPAQDATLTPRLISRRGLMLGAEYRWLTPHTEGRIDAEYLPDDRSADDDRGGVLFAHRGDWSTRWRSDLLYQEVSDLDYLEDFGDQLELRSTSQLERQAQVAYLGDDWRAVLRAQTFQTIDRDLLGSRPYHRLPQLQLSAHRGDLPWGLGYDVAAELVSFDHPEQRVTGERLDLYPRLGWRLERSWGYLHPRLGWRYTRYALHDTATGADDAPTRAAPVFSTDAGLFFDRPVRWLGRNATQTLEPRLFYLHVPAREQDHLPLFDTSEIDPSYAWLFLDNRYSGADRLGDANQLTTAVTTRFIDDATGIERLRLSLGQIQYFRDREVTLTPGDQIDSRSDLFAQARGALGRAWSVSTRVQWDPQASETRRAALDVGYRLSGNLANLGYRYTPDELEQIDLTARWRLNPQWHVVGRWNYSLRDHRDLDTFVGFEYGACCWNMRVVARHSRSDLADLEAETSLMLELELKGLSNVGAGIERLLGRSISGYPRTRYY